MGQVHIELFMLALLDLPARRNDTFNKPTLRRGSLSSRLPSGVSSNVNHPAERGRALCLSQAAEFF